MASRGRVRRRTRVLSSSVKSRNSASELAVTWCAEISLRESLGRGCAGSRSAQNEQPQSWRAESALREKRTNQKKGREEQPIDGIAGQFARPGRPAPASSPDPRRAEFPGASLARSAGSAGARPWDRAGLRRRFRASRRVVRIRPRRSECRKIRRADGRRRWPASDHAFQNRGSWWPRIRRVPRRGDSAFGLYEAGGASFRFSVRTQDLGCQS